MADQRCAVAKTALDHAIGELDRGVQMFRIIKSVEPKVRPLVERREIIPRERINMSGGAKHRFVPPSLAPQTLQHPTVSPPAPVDARSGLNASGG